MSQHTIQEHISRIKAVLKLNNADARLTDRHIFSLMKKHAVFLLKRDSSWLRVPSTIYQVLHKFDIKEVDAVEACGVDTNCKIKRTIEKLPGIVENVDGPIIRRVTSLDGSIILTPIESSGYLRKQGKSTAKYDKTLYYWYINGYLYFPNIKWDAVRIEAYFEDEVNDVCDEVDACSYKQDSLFIIPEFLLSAMDQLIIQDLSIYLKIPQDQLIQKNENIKQ
jgi:hypothetical protein